MKKILLVLFIFLFVVGCTSKPFELDDEYYNKNELIDITSEELIELEDSKKSFVVFIYTQGCITCFDFEKYLDEFQEKNSITIYAMNAEEMKKTNIYDYVKYSPSVVLFKDGKKVAYLDAESNDDKPYYESTEGLTEWFAKYIVFKIS